jgi:hypothetical protein
MYSLLYRKRLAGAVLAVWLAAVACNSLVGNTSAQTQTRTQAVDLEGAGSARVRIDFPAGRLKVEHGAAGLMQATFTSNVADWEPQVDYQVDGDQGELVVDQRDADLTIGRELINEWTIQLNDSVPLDLEIHTGAGESTLDLSAMNVTALRVETGAGSTNLDLSGGWDHDVTVTLTGGVGEIKVKLPGEMGVRVNLDTALVGVTTTGLEKDGNGYINQAYGAAAHTLTLDIQAGIGSIELAAP